MKILIIEDELPAARQLTKLLTGARSNIQVIETLDSVNGAVNWLRTFPSPDLIFMDIQIADGLSFEIFKQVSIDSAVIFTTAFDQYAVQAFKVNAIDYLLKPVDPEELHKSLEKFEQQRGSQVIDFTSISRYFQPEQHKDRFLVKNGQHFTFIQVEDIGYFRSSEGLTQAFCNNGKKYFVDNSLDDLERLLDPRLFFRVSRSMMIHVRSVVKIFPHLNGRLKLEVSPKLPEDVLVSRDRAGEFKVWLGG